jgi:hypothetical protein
LLARNGERPATDGAVNGARKFKGVGNVKTSKPDTKKSQALRAELFGSDRCNALGIVAHSSSPVLALCRKLIKAGYDPRTQLEAYRGDVLCLSVRSLGEGVHLRVAGHGVGFFIRRQMRSSPAHALARGKWPNP